LEITLQRKGRYPAPQKDESIAHFVATFFMAWQAMGRVWAGLWQASDIQGM